MWKATNWTVGTAGRRGVTLAALALVGWFPPAGHAQVQPATVEPGPEFATPTTLDRAGRIVAPVEINGRGPFRFILDTGANRSALAPHMLPALGLPATGQFFVDVHGVTGSAVMPAVRLASLRVGNIELRDVTVPVLANVVFAGTDGILGVEGLQDARVEVDFTQDRVLIDRTGGRRAPSGYLRVPARLEKGGLLMVEGRVGRIRAKIIIDTGAERTLGNIPLRDALQHRVDRRDRMATTVVGVTPDVRNAVSFRSPTISIGQARLRNLPVAFDDLPVFELWGLADEPALLIGMDLLGTLQHFVVDYPRREFQLKTRPGLTKPGFRRCAPYECSSRIRIEGT